MRLCLPVCPSSCELSSLNLIMIVKDIYIVYNMMCKHSTIFKIIIDSVSGKCLPM